LTHPTYKQKSKTITGVSKLVNRNREHTPTQAHTDTKQHRKPLPTHSKDSKEKTSAVFKDFSTPCAGTAAAKSAVLRRSQHQQQEQGSNAAVSDSSISAAGGARRGGEGGGGVSRESDGGVLAKVRMLTGTKHAAAAARPTAMRARSEASRRSSSLVPVGRSNKNHCGTDADAKTNADTNSNTPTNPDSNMNMNTEHKSISAVLERVEDGASFGGNSTNTHLHYGSSHSDNTSNAKGGLSEQSLLSISTADVLAALTKNSGAGAGISSTWIESEQKEGTRTDTHTRINDDDGMMRISAADLVALIAKAQLV